MPFTPIEETDISKSTNRFTTGTTYDDAGQVLTDSKFRQMSFAYDGNGRQVRAIKANTPDAGTVYDALGNRVATKIYDVWQYMVYDAFGKLVAEYGIPAAGAVGGVNYVQQDHQGSVRAVTNASGVVVARIDHQAFGEEIGFDVGLRSAMPGYSAGKATRQGYGLTENDQATGQQHTWFRKLETMAGRWTRPDPYKGSMKLGNPQSFNRYSYVNNKPTNFVDPSGLDSQILEGLGAAANALNNPNCSNFLNRKQSGNKTPAETLFNLIRSGNFGSNRTFGANDQFSFSSEYGERSPNIGAVTRGDGRVYEYTSTGSSIVAYAITINPAGFYYTLRNSNNVRVNTLAEFSGLSNAEIRGAVILHELAHVLGAILDDGEDSALSRANSMLIKIFCFSNRQPREVRTEGPGISTEIGLQSMIPLPMPTYQSMSDVDWAFFWLHWLSAWADSQIEDEPLP